MAKISFLWIGKTKEHWIAQGIKHYLSRIRRFVQASSIEIKDPTRRKATTKDRLKEAEESCLKKAMPRTAHVVVLDEAGKTFSSEKFSRFLALRLSQPPAHVVFLLGGPYGVTEAIKGEADLVLSLSPMTFTHEMSRVILLEQIYRALTIEKGLPYHH